MDFVAYYFAIARSNLDSISSAVLILEQAFTSLRFLIACFGY